MLLHEFGHGLGFSSLANAGSGQLFLGKPDVYSKYYFDVLLGKGRLDMNNVERRISAVNTGNVVWSGRAVTDAVSSVLEGEPFLEVTTATDTVQFSAPLAAFSGPLVGDVTGGIVAALTDPAAGNDGVGPMPAGTPFDGCRPFTNAADVAGKIALVDRGRCSFIFKAFWAYYAGATGLVVANNQPGAAFSMGGVLNDLPFPAVMITQADGAYIRAALPDVTARIFRHEELLAGAHPVTGQAKLYAPNPVEPGSSISHWDTSAFPNQLMEPFINSDLTTALDVNPNGGGDLTMSLFRDIGWYPDANLDRVRDDVDACPAADPAATVVIGGVDTGVPNTTLVNGCTIGQRVAPCGGGNHGAFLSCVTALADELAQDGYITATQKSALVNAAAGTN